MVPMMIVTAVLIMAPNTKNTEIISLDGFLYNKKTQQVSIPVKINFSNMTGNDNAVFMLVAAVQITDAYGNAHELPIVYTPVEIDSDATNPRITQQDAFPTRYPINVDPVDQYGNLIEGLVTIDATVELRNPSGTTIDSKNRTEPNVCIGYACNFLGALSIKTIRRV